MASTIIISDYVHIAYNKIFHSSSDGHDSAGEPPFLVLDFAYRIDGEMVDDIRAESRHQFAQCSSSSLRAFIRQHEPLPLGMLLDPEDAENDSERISDVVASLVAQCAGVEGLKMLVVDVFVQINEEEEDGFMVPSYNVEDDDVAVESYDVGLLRERRMNVLVKKVCDGEGMDDVCAICLNEMKAGEKMVCTPCAHWFHESCIGRWFENAGNCPLCRLNIEPL